MACTGFAAYILLTVTIVINFSFVETYFVQREIVYVKEVSDGDTDTEYPRKVFLSLHKDESSDSFRTILLEKYMEDFDIGSSENLNEAITRRSQSKRQNIYKVNDGQSFIILNRLPEQHFHVRGNFCMDGKFVTIEPLTENNDLHQKHYFSLRNFATPVCNTDISYQKGDFEKDDENKRPQTFKLSNAFGTFSKETKLKERFKREVEQLTIELLMVIDYAAYSWWEAMIGKSENVESDIMTVIRQYYAYVFQGIDARFSSITTQPFVINLAFSGLFVAKTEHESYWTTTSTIDGDGDSTRVMVNSSEALEKFQKWLDEADFLPKYDHAILFTGTNLTYAGSPGNTGLAFASSMCRNISNSSIVEDIFDFRTITYATQQVARALGTRDDMDNNDCLEFFNFIMVPKFKLPIKSFASNKWQFSTCSEQYLTDYNVELKEDGLTCLKETSLNEKYPEELLSLVKELPGVTYSGKVQCENAFGLQSDVCRIEIGISYSKICSGLLCTYPGSDKCGFILPADGTPCGNKKYCWQGNCLEHENASESSDTCTFGNDASIGCYRLVVSEPSQCYIEDIRYKCCKTCEIFYTGIAGCEYGDRSDDCTLGGCVDGDQDYASKTCCLTCLDGPTPFARPVLSTTTESATLISTTSEPFTSSSPLSSSSSSSSSQTIQSPSLSPHTSASLVVSSIMTGTTSSSSLASFMSTSTMSFPFSSPSNVTFVTSDRQPGQPKRTTVPGQEADSRSSVLHLEQEFTTLHSSTGKTHGIDIDEFTVLSQDSSTVQQTENVYISTVINTLENTDTLITDILSETETTPSSTTAAMASVPPSKQAITHKYTTEEMTVGLLGGINTKNLISAARTTKPSLQNDSSKLESETICSCHDLSARATIASPTKQPFTETTVSRKCRNSTPNQSVHYRLFFKEVARSMQDNQRRINNGVYQNVRSLYVAVSGQLKGFQREYENENESWREGSETPSNDDDDLNRKLGPIWKKYYRDLIRDLKRNVREMRYQVLALINRHLKDQIDRTL